MMFEAVTNLGDDQLKRLSEVVAEAVYLSGILDVDLPTQPYAFFLALCNCERLVREQSAAADFRRNPERIGLHGHC